MRRKNRKEETYCFEIEAHNNDKKSSKEEDEESKTCEVEIETIQRMIDRIEKLKLTREEEEKVTTCDGTRNCNKFLGELDNYKIITDEKKALILAAQKLKGKTSDWFYGANGIWFKSYNGFVREFTTTFCKEEESDMEKLMKTLIKGYKTRHVEEYTMKLFAL